MVDGSYVYKSGKVYKVPANETEALSTSLMGLFEKRRFRKFIIWAANYKKDDQKTWQNISPGTPMSEVYKHFGLDPNTQDFTGHAMRGVGEMRWKGTFCRKKGQFLHFVKNSKKIGSKTANQPVSA